MNYLKLKDSIEKQKSLCFKRLLLELRLKLLRRKHISLVTEILGSKNLLALPHILKVTFVRHRVKGGGFNNLTPFTLLLHFFL